MILQFCGLNSVPLGTVPKKATSPGITNLIIRSCTCCQLIINTPFEKLWDHLGKRENLDLRSIKIFKSYLVDTYFWNGIHAIPL